MKIKIDPADKTVMSQDNKVCQICGEIGHSKFYCPNRIAYVRRYNLDGTHDKTYTVDNKPKKIKKIKPKKPSRSKLKKDLDKLVKDSIKTRDNFTCQYCGKKVSGSDCHASHVISVGSHADMQFEPLNLKVLCYHHHINWWHKLPTESGDWFKQKFPERMKYLDDRKQQSIKLKDFELQLLIDEYRAKLKL